MLTVKNEVGRSVLRAGVIHAAGVTVQPCPPGLKARIDALLRLHAAGGGKSCPADPAEALKSGVRNMLRAGGYKPSGRSKPASEYLLRAAAAGEFPFINNLVDINNYLSLSSGLPISLLDAARTSCDLLLRLGRAGEAYVFNQTGQVIELAGLICLCRAEPEPGVPLGTPVKDSMQGKIGAETRDVIGVIYAPPEFVDEGALRRQLETFADLLSAYGGAAQQEQVIS